MAIDDKDKGSTGSSGKSPTKFKERPSDRDRKAHPENTQAGESPLIHEQDSAVERQQEGQDEDDSIREKVRRTIPRPGHPGKKPAENPSDKGISGENKPQEGEEKEKGDAESCL
jgi:hypothetical protein